MQKLTSTPKGFYLGSAQHFYQAFENPKLRISKDIIPNHLIDEQLGFKENRLYECQEIWNPTFHRSNTQLFHE